MTLGRGPDLESLFLTALSFTVHLMMTVNEGSSSGESTRKSTEGLASSDKRQDYLRKKLSLS